MAMRLSDVEMPEEEEYLSTGIPGLDACLAESEEAVPGIPLGSSILLSGSPGGGKSSLSLFFADAGKDSLILSGEEKPKRTKKRWARLGLGKTGADPFIDVLSDAEEALTLVRDIKPRMTVVDSVQTISLNGSRKYDAQSEAVEMLIGQTGGSGGSVVFVCHVSKNGKDHAGAMALAHLVDVHLHVSVNAKKMERALEVRKNRHGRAGFQVPMYIGQSSLTIGTPAPITGDGSMAGARSALERATEKAYELLMNAESLNAYDFDRAGVSGGIWRAGLELACKRLSRDGFEVIEEKVKGRKTVRLVNPPPKSEPDVVETPAGLIVPPSAVAATAGGEQYPHLDLD